jgi:chromosome segregation ATPase
MNRHCLNGTATVVLAFVGLSIGAAQAQVARPSSGGGQSAELVQQLQQLGSERTALNAENAKLKKELDATRKERDLLKKAQQTFERRVKASEATVKSLEDSAAARRNAADQELARTKDNLQQLIAKFRETAAALREVEADRAQAKQTIVAREQALKLCVDRNLALYQLNQEVLTRLENQSVLGRMARAEPFTQIKRVQLENLVDEYKSRADDQRQPSDQAAAGPSSPAAAPAPASTPSQSH